MTGHLPPQVGEEECADLVVDSGLATERTFLAWQRTSLGVIAASGIATRYVAPAVGGYLPVAVGIAGIIFGLGALVWTRLRYRAAHTAQTKHGSLGSRGGGPFALIAGSAALLAVLVGLLPFKP